MGPRCTHLSSQCWWSGGRKIRSSKSSLVIVTSLRPVCCRRTCPKTENWQKPWSKCSCQDVWTILLSFWFQLHSPSLITAPSVPTSKLMTMILQSVNTDSLCLLRRNINIFPNEKSNLSDFSFKLLVKCSFKLSHTLNTTGEDWKLMTTCIPLRTTGPYLESGTRPGVSKIQICSLLRESVFQGDSS